MFNQISWEQFFLSLGIFFALYYGYVAIRYFGKELSKMFELKISSRNKKQPSQTSIILSETEFAEVFAELEQINAELRKKVFPAFARSKDKKVLLFQISQKLESFKGLKVPAFRHAINNCIHAEAKKIGLEITHEELEERWKTIIENMLPNKSK
ncbi:hypothetical protein [Negadavirga shengliensis]|uniref:Uncharacterized protein n=1 Tax=Negadavirga shengliensis TaxID=1389218 RepID=A0ABV9T0Z2_9BACT